MTLRKSVVLFIILLFQFALGQNDTIVLKELVFSDNQLRKYSNSKVLQTITDSVIMRNRGSLTSLLNNNTTIYFKENGLGMVSSPSFRGTTAQQTAVIWNGININSQLNGLTDINTINSTNYNSVLIRPGGGSSIYGSSAIGGSIHLNNTLHFEKEFENQLLLRYGSFSTSNIDYNLIASTNKISSQLSISRNDSKNNYRYLGTDLINENGQFYNTSLNLNFGYKLNSNNILKFYSQLFNGERHFSGTLVAPSKSKFNDLNSRNLVEYSYSNRKLISIARLALLSESYKYFEDKDSEIYSFGKSETAIAKYDFTYKLSDKIQLNTLLDYTTTKGFGSDLKENSRQIVSAVLLMKHQVTHRFLYEVNFRKEETANYKSPMLFSIGSNFKATDFYTVKFNFSKNFRIPTFNDLYWMQGGNENLNPELAIQYELNQVLTFKNINLTVSGFYNRVKDLINWKPNSSGLWQPINTNRVQIYGLESTLGYENQILNNHTLKVNLNYAYTVSENQETKKQLIYVPYHKLTTNLAYQYRRVTFFYSHLFNGIVFTSLDNEYFLNEYSVFNSGIEYQFNKYICIGFQVNNIFNEKYQVVAQRPFPGRNFNINFNFNI